MPKKKVYFDPENEQRPYLGINAVIMRDHNGKQEILLGKRKGVAGDGNWYVPGGHAKYGESLATSLRREIKEETGLNISQGKLVWVYENFTGGPHHVILFYEAHLVDPSQVATNLEPDRCSALEWFTLDKLPQPLWADLDRLLERYVLQNSGKISL